jgi:hypothetical protein
MDSAEDFERYARECIRLASLTDNQEIKTRLIEMAREWMNAAMEPGSDTSHPVAA